MERSSWSENFESYSNEVIESFLGSGYILTRDDSNLEDLLDNSEETITNLELPDDTELIGSKENDAYEIISRLRETEVKKYGINSPHINEFHVFRGIGISTRGDLYVSGIVQEKEKGIYEAEIVLEEMEEADLLDRDLKKFSPLYH